MEVLPMSAMGLRNVENQLELLSYTEQLSLMEFLIKALKRHDSEKTPSDSSWISDIFAVMDSSPVYSNGQKWSREELYER